jgi:hypothetical protein
MPSFARCAGHDIVDYDRALKFFQDKFCSRIFAGVDEFDGILNSVVSKLCRKRCCRERNIDCGGVIYFSEQDG